MAVGGILAPLMAPFAASSNARLAAGPAPVDLGSGSDGRIDGAAPGDRAGFSASAAGDVNGAWDRGPDRWRADSGSTYVVFRPVGTIDLAAVGAGGFKGVSLAAVADPAGISATYLQKLERGEIESPSPHRLHALSQVLDVSYPRLMELAGYVIPREDSAARDSVSLLAQAFSAEDLTDGGARLARARRLAMPMTYAHNALERVTVDGELGAGGAISVGVAAAVTLLAVALGAVTLRRRTA